MSDQPRRWTATRVVGPLVYVHAEHCPAEGDTSTDGRIWRCRDCGHRTRIVVKAR